MILKDPDKITIENPGSIITGKPQMLKGGISEPRNKSIMKMFNLIRVGERAGSGVPDIFSVWDEEGWSTPIVEEHFKPDRTILTLAFSKKQANKTSEQADKQANKQISKRTSEHIGKIREYLESVDEASSIDIASAIGLSPARTRAILSEMTEEIEAIGATNKRRYRKK